MWKWVGIGQALFTSKRDWSEFLWEWPGVTSSWEYSVILQWLLNRTDNENYKNSSMWIFKLPKLLEKVAAVLLLFLCTLSCYTWIWFQLVQLSTIKINIIILQLNTIFFWWKLTQETDWLVLLATLLHNIHFSPPKSKVKTLKAWCTDKHHTINHISQRQNFDQ